MDPLTVLALAQLDEEYRAVVGRLPERPGRDPELAAAVRRQIEADDSSAGPLRAEVSPHDQRDTGQRPKGRLEDHVERPAPGHCATDGCASEHEQQDAPEDPRNDACP
ncbi:hypothetical protein UQW22_09810 [Isoptericola halotolerans]|uniref:hypothetical protein n=1 Tax=Isoptericola halotolerans TaxID=300560 RepID=UPI00388D23A4